MAIFSAIASAIGAIGSAIGSAASAIGGALGAGGLGGLLAGVAGVAGVGLQIYGMSQQAKGQKMQAAASEKAEQLRFKQMNLQAARERRTSLRQAILARAQALSNATASNAGQGSGIMGGMAQIGGQLGNNLQGISQGQQIGRGMFDANMQMTKGQQYESIGAGFKSFGGMLAGNYENIRRIFS